MLVSSLIHIRSSIHALLLASRYREAGFHVIEFNASDQRNKGAMEGVVKQLIDNRGVDEYFSAQSSHHHTSHPTCIIMDEVDGISGNEDRGGLQLLVQLIQRSRLPIICIANDASTPKMKTLKGYTMHLIWRRPTAEQIMPRLTAIAAAEGLDVDVNAMRKLIEATQADIRQTINYLQMHSKTHRRLQFDTVQAAMDKGGGKDFDTGVFDVVPQLFRDPGRKAGWVEERSDLFFVDSSLVPLFVQEAYLKCRPRVDPGQAPRQAEAQAMEMVSKAADMISDADSISARIYSEMDYSLMPTYAVLSSVAPAFLMSAGGLSGNLTFPTWLGQNSSRTKKSRLIREMHAAMAVVAPSPLTSFIVDYLPALRTHLLDPFHGADPSEAVDGVCEELEALGLVKEDWDTLVEVTDPFARLQDKTALDTAVKTRFTREWNKREHRFRSTRATLKVDAGAGLKAATNEDEEEVKEPVDDVEGSGEEEKEDAIGKHDLMIQKLKDTNADSPKGKGSGGKGSRGGRGGAGGKGAGGRGGRGRGGRGSRGRGGARGGGGGARGAKQKGKKGPKEERSEDDDGDEDMTDFIVDDDDDDNL